MGTWLCGMAGHVHGEGWNWQRGLPWDPPLVGRDGVSALPSLVGGGGLYWQAVRSDWGCCDGLGMPDQVRWAGQGTLSWLGGAGLDWRH